MQVPSNKRAFWKKNFDQGDVTALVEFTGSSQPTITKALNKGEAKSTLIIMIDQFFEKKLQSIQSK
jgi:hypothetical protein